MRSACLAAAAFLAVTIVVLSSSPASASTRRHAHVPLTTMQLCVDDPCNPCPPFTVVVCAPACPLEAPCVSWRDGAFGRRVATYVWPSTGYRVDVVVTRRGEVIVRD
jgi:hypothetical protein